MYTDKEVRVLVKFHSQYPSTNVACCDYCHKQFPTDQVTTQIPVSVNKDTGMDEDYNNMCDECCERYKVGHKYTGPDPDPHRDPDLEPYAGI